MNLRDTAMQAIELEVAIDQKHEIHKQTKPVTLGLFRGQIEMSEDFDEPLPDSFWLGEDKVS